VNQEASASLREEDDVKRLIEPADATIRSAKQAKDPIIGP
jgi:hypothetical protein